MSRRQRNVDGLSRSRRCIVEALERRTLLADLQFVWVGGSGNWTDPSNWVHNEPEPPDPDRDFPSHQDSVTISAAGSTITIPAGVAATGKVLSLEADLRIEGGAGRSLAGNLSLVDAVVTTVGSFNGIVFENTSNPLTPKTFSIAGNGTIECQGNGTQITTGTGGGIDSLVLGADVTLRAAGTNVSARISAKDFTNFGTILSDAPTTGLGVNIEEKAPFPSSFTNRGMIRTSNGGIVGLGLMVPTSKLTWQTPGRSKSTAARCDWAATGGSPTSATTHASAEAYRRVESSPEI